MLSYLSKRIGKGVLKRNFTTRGMENIDPRQGAILRFWYGDCLDTAFNQEKTQKLYSLWYGFDPSKGKPLSKEEKDNIDQDIREKFEEDVDKYANGEYDAWQETPLGVTAICVLGDQFTRNIYRGSGKAFSLDAKTLGIVLNALNQGMDKDLHFVVRANWYLPLMHAEDDEVQQRMIQFFRDNSDSDDPWLSGLAKNSLKFGMDHNVMIRRFGRYPYRNAALGRESTPEELEYLSGEVDSFGQ